MVCVASRDIQNGRLLVMHTFFCIVRQSAKTCRAFVQEVLVPLGCRPKTLQKCVSFSLSQAFGIPRQGTKEVAPLAVAASTLASLYVASANGHTDVVGLLLAKGARVDAAMRDGATALYVASQKGHAHIVELLVEKGPRVDAPMQDGTTPLYIASQFGHAGEALAGHSAEFTICAIRI